MLGAPTLRLRGDYLALVTLGFGEVVKAFLKNTEAITAGTRGLSPVPPPTENLDWASDYRPFYYLTLGVPKDAKPEEIKKAYRKLARESHPDANKDDAKAETRFKEISEAYGVLSDPGRRKEYDDARALFGSGGFRVPRPGSGGGSARACR